MKNSLTCSVIIPAFNEERYIELCLKAISSQSLERNKYEIIVIDNGSTDETVNIAKNYADRVEIKPGIKVGAIRNYGALHSLGDFLVFLDSDCITDPDWLQRGINKLESQPQTALGGIYRSRNKPNWIEKYWLLETEKKRAHQKDFLGGCIFILREHFDLVGGFKEDLTSGEDSQLTFDLRKKGIITKIDPTLEVIHLGNPNTIREFILRQSWHAKSYKSMMSKNLTDPVFYLMIIYLALILASSIIMTLGSYYLPSLLLIQAPPVILSCKRIIRSGFKPTVQDFFKVLALDNLYLIGRLMGFLSPTK